MLSGDESAELRELQHRAYAPQGGLSAADAERLRELQDLRGGRGTAGSGASLGTVPSAKRGRGSDLTALGITVPADPTASAATPDDASPRVGLAGAAASFADTAEDPAEVTAATGGWAGRARHRGFAWAAGAAVLLVGVGAGWVLAESRHAPASLSATAERQDRAEQILPAGADPGSLVALGQYQDVIAWYTTKDAGEFTCLLLDDGEKSETACRRTAELSDTVLANVLEIDSSPEYLETVFGTLALTPDRRPAVALNGYRTTLPSVSRFADADEERIARGLKDAGYRMDTINVSGYYDDVPIWTAVRGSTEQCLVYVAPDADPVADCNDAMDADGEPLRLEFTAVRGADTYSVTAELPQAPNYSPYLVITERPVETIVIDVESGERVGVGIDGDPDGVSGDGIG